MMMETLGFITAWHNGCFKTKKTPFFPELGQNPSIHSIPKGPLGRVVEYVTEIFGVDRRLIIMSWTKTEKKGTSLLVTEHDKIMGYCVVRPLQETKCHRIGPLYALNTAETQVLILALISVIPDEVLYITAPLTNPSFIRLLTNDLRLKQINETVRMYTKKDHEISTHKMFAIVDTNVG
ncbi:holothin acyltransferase-like [Antedon mediterranea]|uniref:holothin acyltransferase-like n=1 Tax=Antedon mediterranea TaxID=105859 RepID=UPI003AF8B1D3